MAWFFLSLLFLACVLAYQGAAPLGEAPDEPAHILYAKAWLSPGVPAIPQRPDGENYEFHQPPLPYFLAASWLRWLHDSPAEAMPKLPASAGFDFEDPPKRFVTPEARRPGFSALRLTQIFWALIFLVSFVSVASLAARGDGERCDCPELRFAAFALFLFSPQLIFSFATFGNDAALIALSTLVFSAMLVRSRLGLAFFLSALALWTKASAAFLCAPLLGALVIYSRGESWGFPLHHSGKDVALGKDDGERPRFLPLWIRRLWVRRALVGAGIGSVLVVGILLFQDSRTDSSMATSSLALANWEKSGSLGDVLALDWLPTLVASFWAKFGWFNVSLPLPAYVFFLLPSALVLWGAWRTIRGRDPRSWIALLAASSIFALLMIFLVTVAWQPQGRLLLPAISAVAFLAARGLEDIAGGWPARHRRALAISLVAGALLMVATGLWQLTSVYSP